MVGLLLKGGEFQEVVEGAASLVFDETGDDAGTGVDEVPGTGGTWSSLRGSCKDNESGTLKRGLYSYRERK